MVCFSRSVEYAYPSMPECDGMVTIEEKYNCQCRICRNEHVSRETLPGMEVLLNADMKGS